jgi:hypothetical protein
MSIATAGRWTAAVAAIVLASGLTLSGCTSSGDGMMKKGDGMMKTDDKMMDKK